MKNSGYNGLLSQTIPQKTFGTFLPTKAEKPAYNAVLNKLELKRAGAFLQACFFEHINMVLLNLKGIHAEISSFKERNSPEAKARNLDAKKPICDTEYQRANEEFRQLQLKHDALNKSNTELQFAMDILQKTLR